MADPVFILLRRGCTDPHDAIGGVLYPKRADAVAAQEHLNHNHPNIPSLGELVPHAVFLSFTAPEEVPEPPEVEGAAELVGETTAL